MNPLRETSDETLKKKKKLNLFSVNIRYGL